MAALLMCDIIMLVKDGTEQAGVGPGFEYMTVAKVIILLPLILQ